MILSKVYLALGDTSTSESKWSTANGGSVRPKVVSPTFLGIWPAVELHWSHRQICSQVCRQWTALQDFKLRTFKSCEVSWLDLNGWHRWPKMMHWSMLPTRHFCCPTSFSRLQCLSQQVRSSQQASEIRNQLLNLQTPGCNDCGTATHEILHAMGLLASQPRSMGKAMGKQGGIEERQRKEGESYSYDVDMSHSQEHIHLLVSFYPTLTGSALATFQIVVSDLSVEDSERWVYLFGAQVYCSNMLQPDIWIWKLSFAKPSQHQTQNWQSLFMIFHVVNCQPHGFWPKCYAAAPVMLKPRRFSNGSSQSVPEGLR